MGGRRRSSKSQGIRKKRNSVNRQTLAKIAERKEQQEIRLEAKLSKSEARLKEAQRSHLGVLQDQSAVTNGVDSPDTLADSFEDDDENDQQSRIIAWNMENRKTAYRNLVDSLRCPMYNADVNISKELKKEKMASAHKRTRVSSKELVNGKVSLPIEEKNENHKGVVQTKSVEEENHDAALREKKHFDSHFKPVKHVDDRPSMVGCFPGVGKVSATISEGERNVLKDRMTNGLSTVSEKSLGLQPSVHAKWKVHQNGLSDSQVSEGDRYMTPAHCAFVSVLRDFKDVFISRKFSDLEEDLLRRLYVAHCLAHVLRCRGRVLRNDTAVKKDEIEDEDGVKDQGYSRARVLILLPMKNVAYEVVKMLTGLAVGTKEGETDVSHIANSERFESEFAPDDNYEMGCGTDDEAEMDVEDPGRQLRKGGRKPRDYRHMFRGNIDDDFKFGMSFSKKHVKLYSDFYASDIIIASPLGLRRSIAEKASGMDTHSKFAKEKDMEDMEWKTGLSAGNQKRKTDEAEDDYLSSIEICIVDGVHVFSMQNFETVGEVLKMVNNMPSDTRNTDFSRVRDWCLDGLMRRFRQTVMISRYRKSEFFGLMRDFCNHAGRVDMTEEVLEHGSMSNVVVKVRQTLFRVGDDTDSLLQAPDKRLKSFCEETLLRIRRIVDGRSLVVVPSYFDFVRLRNKLVKIREEEDMSLSFACMCEYSKGKDISRVRSRLYDGSVSIVVMTERFHFFWRHWIRGANVVVWYGLPENAEFYAEIVNMTAEEAEMGKRVVCMGLFNRFDAYALERIVGRDRCKKMLGRGSRSAYVFV